MLRISLRPPVFSANRRSGIGSHRVVHRRSASITDSLSVEHIDDDPGAIGQADDIVYGPLCSAPQTPNRPLRALRPMKAPDLCAAMRAPGGSRKHRVCMEQMRGRRTAAASSCRLSLVNCWKIPMESRTWTDHSMITDRTMSERPAGPKPYRRDRSARQ